MFNEYKGNRTIRFRLDKFDAQAYAAVLAIMERIGEGRFVITRKDVKSLYDERLSDEHSFVVYEGRVMKDHYNPSHRFFITVYPEETEITLEYL